MRSAAGGPRVLLRRLRETMAEQVSAQERLDKIVVLIAANMVAEVCSCYVLRIDNTLELYATEGLNRDAVHRTVLNAHEGLVGLVASEASPLNLSDADRKSTRLNSSHLVISYAVFCLKKKKKKQNKITTIYTCNTLTGIRLLC